LSYAPTVRSTVRTTHPDRNPDLDVTDANPTKSANSAPSGAMRTRPLGPGQWRDRTQQRGLPGREANTHESLFRWAESAAARGLDEQPVAGFDHHRRLARDFLDAAVAALYRIAPAGTGFAAREPPGRGRSAFGEQ